MKKYLRNILLSIMLLSSIVWLTSPATFSHAQGPSLPSTQSIAINSSDTTVLVAGVPGKRIRVIAIVLVANSGSKATWRFDSFPTSTQLTGNLYIISGPNGTDGRAVATTVVTFAPNPFGWFQTEVGDSLLLKNVDANPVAGLSGVLVYDLVNP